MQVDLTVDEAHYILELISTVDLPRTSMVDKEYLYRHDIKKKLRTALQGGQNVSSEGVQCDEGSGQKHSR